MAVLAYPSTLPMPAQAVVLTPVPTRREYGRPGPFSVRVYGVDRLYQGTAQLVLTPAQVEAFRAWWATDLVQGGCWFAASWPTQRGSIQQAWRLTAPPQYEHLAVGIWRVSLAVEVRGAGPVPDDGVAAPPPPPPPPASSTLSLWSYAALPITELAPNAQITVQPPVGLSPDVTPPPDPDPRLSLTVTGISGQSTQVLRTNGLDEGTQPLAVSGLTLEAFVGVTNPNDWGATLQLNAGSVVAFWFFGRPTASWLSSLDLTVGGSDISVNPSAPSFTTPELPDMMHAALVIAGTSVSCYLGGERIYSGTIGTDITTLGLTWGASSQFAAQRVFRTSGGSIQNLKGFRLSNVARYSGASITPPSTPFTLD